MGELPPPNTHGSDQRPGALVTVGKMSSIKSSVKSFKLSSVKSVGGVESVDGGFFAVHIARNQYLKYNISIIYIMLFKIKYCLF